MQNFNCCFSHYRVICFCVLLCCLTHCSASFSQGNKQINPNEAGQEEANAEKPVGGIKLSLHDTSPMILPVHYAGEPVIVAARIESNFKEGVVLLNFTPSTYVWFDVVKRVGEKEEKVPKTQFGQSLRPPIGNEGHSGAGPMLKSGKLKVEIKYNLTRRFDLSKPGTYVVSAYVIPFLMGIPDGKAVGKIIAKPLVIKVRVRRSENDDGVWSLY